MKSNVNRFLGLSIVIIALFSCQKNDGPAGNGDTGYSTPKGSTPVNTQFMAYAYENDQQNFPLHLVFLHSPYTPYVLDDLNYQDNFAGFGSNGAIEGDKYLSRIRYNTTLTFYNLGFNQYKTFPASSKVKNYFGVKYQGYQLAGNVRNLVPETKLDLPGGGSVTFPTLAFASSSFEENYNIYVTYSAPSLKDYALNSPGPTFADVKGTRKFLDSYGMAQVWRVLTYCNCNILSSSDLLYNEATLKLPITPDRTSSAPDSVEAWYFIPEFQTWEQRGFAYKNNGFYEKKIRTVGVWSFAKPRDGVYITLQLRTSNDMPLPNTRFLVKDAADEVAEGRSDAEGNALVLLPANRKLEFSIINDHNYFNSATNPQSIGPFSTEAEKKVIIPDRTDISTLEGSVIKCDGTSFGNGTVVVNQRNAKDEYIFPIVNGKFNMATWLSTYYSDSKLTFRDEGGATVFQVDSYLGSDKISHLKRLRHNFYACPDYNQLYCNYRIDNTNFTITGKTDQLNLKLIAKPVPGYWEIYLQDGNKGIAFYMWILGGPTGDIGGGDPLVINNIASKFDPNGSNELTIYRNDAVIGGFMEGWFAIDYLDANNTPHKASGNFRIKITN